MTIAWTPELGALVYSSRARRNPAFVAETLRSFDVTSPIDPVKARKAAAEYWKDKRALARVKLAFDNNPPVWKPIVEKVIARGKKPNAEAPLDLELEAATVTLQMCPLHAAVPYWIAAGGIPFALRALIRCHGLLCSALEFGYRRQGVDLGLWILETRKLSVDWPAGYADAWALLRALLSEAVEPIYDEAHGIADQALLATATGNPNESALQILLPFAFPDERAWAKAGAKAAIGLAKQRKRGYTPALASFVSVAPAAAAIELLGSTVNDAITAADLATALAHLGTPDGVKVLEAALATAPNAADRERWGAVLFAVRTGEAMKAFARLAKHPKGKTTFAPLAKRHRELMLATAAAKPGKPTTTRVAGRSRSR